MLAVAALLDLLSDVIAGREIESSRAARSAADHSKGSDADPTKPSQTVGGCGCACASGSIDSRAEVAHNIVAYLFEEAKPGGIGRADMEAFVVLREQQRLSREAFDEFVDGAAALQRVRRVAARTALHRLVARAASPAARAILAAIPGAASGDGIGEQAAALARFLLRARQLLDLPRAVAQGDRCLVSLEDLSRRGLRDRDLTAWLRSPRGVDEATDQRCRLLFDDERNEALALLAGGAALLEALPARESRALAAYLGCWGEALLAAPAFDRSSTSPFTRAIRFRAWRYALSRRLSPQLRGAAGVARRGAAGARRTAEAPAESIGPVAGGSA